MYNSVLVYGIILAHFSSESIAQTSLGVFGATKSITKCGRSRAAIITPLVINGTVAPVGTYPWHAGLYYRTVTDQKESWEQQCGGSLITAQFVLTAAHCVYNRSAADVRVALGKYFRSWNNYKFGEQRRNVSRITNHNDFDSTTYNFDIALLQLDENVVLGDLVMPVCTGNLGTTNYILNKKLYIVGWGQTMNVRTGSSSETLLYNDVMFIPPRVCKDFVPSGLTLFDKFCTMKNNSVCKKYAKSVYMTGPKTIGIEEEKIDTCALVEPIGAPVPDGSQDILELPVNAEPREFPHIAVIGYVNKTHKRPSIRCVGSLISERYVLSAASCSTTPIGPAAWVRLGDYNVNSNKDDDESDSRSVIYDIVQLIDHPDYKRSDDPNDIEYHDIALYRLNTSVQFNKYIRPICLHAGDRFAKTFALVTGWGPIELGGRPNDIFQKANLTIVDDKECSEAYDFNGDVLGGIDTKLAVCAALMDGRDTCTSLTGSPLQIRLQDPYCMYSLAGVAFFNRPCFVKSPGVYTRVSHYLEWIESEVWP